MIAARSSSSPASRYGSGKWLCLLLGAIIFGNGCQLPLDRNQLDLAVLQKELHQRWTLAQQNDAVFTKANTWVVIIAYSRYRGRYLPLFPWQATAELWAASMSDLLPISPDHVLFFLDRPPSEIYQTLHNRLGGKTIDRMWLYLGCHLLENGNLVLTAPQEEISAKRFLAPILAKTREVVFFGDVCHAHSLERIIPWPQVSHRFYAATEDEKAPTLVLASYARRERRLFANFLAARSLWQSHANRYSFFGALVWEELFRLRLEHNRQPDARMLGERIRLRAGTVRPQIRTVSIPHPVDFGPADGPQLKLWQPDPGEAELDKLEAMFKSSPDHFSFTKAYLSIEKIANPDFDNVAYRQALEKIAERVRRYLATSPQLHPPQAMKHVLFDSLEWQNVEASYPEDFLVSHTLKHRVGRCASFSAVYLMLSERFGWRFRAVCLPAHIFVRWFPGAERTRVNIETTLKGRSISDQQYLRFRSIPDTPVAKRFYMRELSPKQALATYLPPLSLLLLARGRLALALKTARMATGLVPEDPIAWNSLGLVFNRLRLRQQAEKAYRRALAINPQMAPAWINLGNILSQPEQRIDAYYRAAELDPDRLEAWYNLAWEWYRQGKYQQAWAAWKQCRRLGMSEEPAYIDDLKQKLKQEP